MIIKFHGITVAPGPQNLQNIQTKNELFLSLYSPRNFLMTNFAGSGTLFQKMVSTIDSNQFSIFGLQSYDAMIDKVNFRMNK